MSDVNPAVDTLEQSLIGGLLFKPQTVEEIIGFLDVEDFSSEFCGWAFSSIIKLHAQRKAVSVPEVAKLAPPSRRDEAIEGLEYCVATQSYGDGVDRLARSVRDNAVKRSMDQMVLNARAMLENSDVSASEMAADLEAALNAALGHNQIAEAGSMIGAEAAEWFEDALSADGSIPGLSTGLRHLDAKLNGLEAGRVYVLAGRTSMGKTALGLSITRSLAMAGHGVHFASLEMPKRELWQRLLSDIAREMERCEYRKIASGDISPEQRGALLDANEIIKEMPLVVDSSSGRSAAQVCSSARKSARLLRARGQSLSCIVVDYLQLIRIERDFSRQVSYGIGQIMKALKGLAKDLNVPVVVLAQLSRRVEDRTNKRPQLSDLRESGDIEQDADIVAFVVRPEYYLDRDKKATDEQRADAKNVMKIYIDKNRGGPVAAVSVYCDIGCNAVRDSDYEFGLGGIFGGKK